MANPTTIALANGAATPVSFNFVPQSYDPVTGIATFADKSAGSAIGWRTLKLQLVEPKGRQSVKSSNERVYRIRYWFTAPVLETLSTNDNGYLPPPTVAYTLRANGEFTIPERATEAERKDLAAFVKNAAACAAVQTQLVKDLEGFF